MKSRQRTKSLYLLLSDDEHARLTKLAEAAGAPLCEIARRGIALYEESQSQAATVEERVTMLEAAIAELRKR